MVSVYSTSIVSPCLFIYSIRHHVEHKILKKKKTTEQTKEYEDEVLD